MVAANAWEKQNIFPTLFPEWLPATGDRNPNARFQILAVR